MKRWRFCAVARNTPDLRRELRFFNSVHASTLITHSIKWIVPCLSKINEKLSVVVLDHDGGVPKQHRTNSLLVL